MRKRAAAVIFDAGRLLVIHRIKHGREYYVLPGGGIEEGESPEQACRREVFEETGLTATHLEQKWTFNNQGHEEFYFLVQTAGGSPLLGGPEALVNSPEDHYLPEWIPIQSIADLYLLPEAAKQFCLQLAGRA